MSEMLAVDVLRTLAPADHVQGWQGRGGAGGAGRKKAAPRAGARGAAKKPGAHILLGNTLTPYLPAQELELMSPYRQIDMLTA
jgi:hypothetical protein